MRRALEQVRHPALLAALAVVVTAVVLTMARPRPVVADILIHTLIWMGIAAAWNLTAGFAGRLSLGHAAYFGLGAYSSAVLYSQFLISPWLGALVGMALAAIVATVIEAATARLLGIYYALATFAFAELLGILARGWRGLTGGTAGLTLLFEPGLANMTFIGKQGYLWLALGFAALSSGVAVWILSTRFGYYLRAQRDEPDAARALGIDIDLTKRVAGAVSAALTALGGTLYAQYLLFVDPDTAFNWYISVQASLICIIGGLGTIAGPLWGALLLVPAERWLQAALGGSYGGLAPMIYGLVLIAAVLLAPRGLFPVFDAVSRRVRPRPAGKTAWPS